MENQTGVHSLLRGLAVAGVAVGAAALLVSTGTVAPVVGGLVVAKIAGAVAARYVATQIVGPLTPEPMSETLRRVPILSRAMDLTMPDRTQPVPPWALVLAQADGGLA